MSINHSLNIKKAFLYCAFWVALALLFNLSLLWWRPPVDALNFFTCYLIEYSLSIDNLFVFSVIFKEFAVPSQYTRRVLFLGIIGAMIFRILLILGGVTIIQKYNWILNLFGAFLILTGLQLLRKKEQTSISFYRRLTRRVNSIIPLTEDYVRDRFFVKKDGHWYATPLFIVLLTIEFADIVFAIDSIPAAMAITLDPFIIFTSNIFAILGLRSLYFIIPAMQEWFHYLNYGLGIIFSFIGVKMVIAPWIEIPAYASLGFIAIVLIVCILFSKKLSTSH